MERMCKENRRSIQKIPQIGDQMISAVFNGYFRSGTTFFGYKLFKNEDRIILYEPFSPNIMAMEKTEKLHKIDPWVDYSHLKFQRYLNKFIKIHNKLKKENPMLFSTEFTYYEPALNYLNKISLNLILQPNRLHFILDKIVEKYKCPVVHIIRNPIDTWISHINPPKEIKKIKHIFTIPPRKFLIEHRNKPIIQKVYTIFNKKVFPKIIPESVFFIGGTWNILSKRFPLKGRDTLEKFLECWTYSNYYAWKAGQDNKKIMIIYYEEVTKNPKKWIPKIEKHLELKANKELIERIKPVLRGNEEIYQFIIHKLERLGLYDTVYEFYPKFLEEPGEFIVHDMDNRP